MPEPSWWVHADRPTFTHFVRTHVFTAPSHRQYVSYAPIGLTRYYWSAYPPSVTVYRITHPKPVRAS